MRLIDILNFIHDHLYKSKNRQGKHVIIKDRER